MGFSERPNYAKRPDDHSSGRFAYGTGLSLQARGGRLAGGGTASSSGLHAEAADFGAGLLYDVGAVPAWDWAAEVFKVVENTT